MDRRNNSLVKRCALVLLRRIDDGEKLLDELLPRLFADGALLHFTGVIATVKACSLYSSRFGIRFRCQSDHGQHSRPSTVARGSFDSWPT
jgi:hypothetical protein